MKIDREAVLSLLPVFYSVFGGKKKVAALLTTIGDIAGAYDIIKSVRDKFRPGPTGYTGVSLTDVEQEQLDRLCRVLDRTSDSLKAKLS